VAPGKIPSVPIRYEDAWAPFLVWTQRENENGDYHHKGKVDPVLNALSTAP
jgi:hypothetical protein